MTLFIITLALIHLSNATSATDKICITGSSVHNKTIDGVYDYIYWDSNRAGAIYYNTEKDMFLFPFIVNDTNHYWSIGIDPDGAVINSRCYVDAAASPYTFSPYDCFSDWMSWDGTWTSDLNMTLVNCNDICLSGCNQPKLDGTYIWQVFNATYQGSVYYCESCGYGTGAYLYPFMYESGASLWLLGGAEGSVYRNAHCFVGWKDKSYIFDLPECTTWVTWQGSWVDDTDFVSQRCVPETAYSCTDQCYSHDETTTCSDDCDCTSTRTCNVSSCQGTDTFDTAPVCVPNPPPTISPTSPTNAPTYCEDYAEYSNHGVNEVVFDYETLQNVLNIYTETTLSNITYLIANDSNSYLDEIVKCIETDCFIQCNDKASCLLSVFEHGGISNNEIIISCNDEYSCFGAEITTQIDAKNHDISIICNATDSCNQMTLDIFHPQSLHIYCLYPRSCHAMYIYLEVDIDLNIQNTTDHGIIYCVSPFACDFMHIVTNSEFTQLIMYEYSKSVLFDNGIGYLSAEQNILCNNDRYITFLSGITETEETVATSILNEYAAKRYPCDDIVVKCGDFECDMDYYINSVNIESLNSIMTVDCYWINIQQLQSITCTGGCEGSPTESPTSAPTDQPTESSLNPTKTPTSHPTTDPTRDPTEDPTADPTIDPTIDPTFDPTFDPTIDPTIDPTMDPTHDPTAAPTLSPSLTPSVAPTAPPSLAPSIAPSTAPSMLPTAAPSILPTNAPSRSPTGNANVESFTTKIDIDFELGNLTTENKEVMVYSIKSVKSKIEEVIQKGYFDTDLLHYDQFMLSIMTMNGVDDDGLTVYDLDINNILGIPVTLSSEIETSAQYSGYIITKSGIKSFTQQVQQDLQMYFSNNDLYFNVSHPDSLIAITPTPVEKESNTAIVLSVFILSLGGAMSALAFVFNKKSGTKVDNAVFVMPFMLSLNIYDFVSDVNLSINMFSRSFKEVISLDNIILYLAIASVTFIILPYASNLIYAMHIINQPAIKQNPAARAWFTTHFRHFILLVVFTAGTYPVLSLTSSRIFGLDFFNAGLLTTDLKALSQIKIRSTIYLENGPQLIIQILYSLMIGLESDTVLAFVASSLSIVATLVIYRAESQGDNIITKYFIQFWNENGLNTDQRQRILERKGLKKHLGEALCSVFTVSKESIEVGYVTPNQNGCIIHVQHSVFKDDLDALKEELFSDKLTSGYNIQVTEEFYVENAFKVLKDEICEVLIKHFELQECDNVLEFDVAYHKRYKDANPLDRHSGKIYQSHSIRSNIPTNDLLHKIKTMHASTRNIGADVWQGILTDDDEAKYNTHLDIDFRNKGIKDNMQLEIELANIPNKGNEGVEGKGNIALQTKAATLTNDPAFNTDPNVMDTLNSMQTEMHKINEQNKAQQQRMDNQMNAMLKILNAFNQNGHNDEDDDIQLTDEVLSQLNSSYLQ